MTIRPEKTHWMAGKLLALALCLVFVPAAQAEQKLLESPPHKKDTLLFMDVAGLLWQRQRTPRLTLVDVRTPKAFARAHIAGALNIPLHQVKTKGFLKKAPFVLIDQGYRIRTLSVECRRLRRNGFQATILSGGLAAWQAAGHPLAGDVFAARELSQAQPRDVFAEGLRDDQVILDLSAADADLTTRLFPLRVRLEGWEGLEKVVAAYHDAPRRTWLIVDRNGDDPRAVRRLHALGLQQVFYLQGGITGYRDYLARQQAAMAPRSSRLHTTRPCVGCASPDEEKGVN